MGKFDYNKWKEDKGINNYQWDYKEWQESGNKRVDLTPPPLVNPRKQLNNRSVTEGIELKPTQPGLLKTIGSGLASGTATLGSNVAKVLDLKDKLGINKFIPRELQALEFIPKLIKPDLYEVGQKKLEEASINLAKPLEKTTGTKKIVGEAAKFIPNLAPAFLPGGLTLTGITSGGGYARQAEKEGATELQQGLYGLAGGAIEAATNKIPIKLLKGQGNGIIKKGLSVLGGAVAEGAQQAFTAPAVNAAKKAIYEPNMKFIGKGGVLDLAQIKSEFITGAVAGGALGAANGAVKGLSNLGKSAFPEWKTTFQDMKPIEAPKPIQEPVLKPSQQLNGTFKVKNIQLEKALRTYDEAIETIQNYFQTNKLTAEEVARIKPELGINLDELVSNIDKYNAGPKLNEFTDKAFYQYAAGIKEAPKKLQVPNLTKLDLRAPIEQPIKPPLTAKGEAAATKIITPELQARSFPQTVAKAEITSPELQRLIGKTDFTYKPLSNKDTLEFARKAVEKNYNDSLNLVKSNSPATAESNAIAQLLINKLQSEGNFTEALEIIEKVSEKATKQGQAIQALSMWGRLTPEGMLRFAQKTIDNANAKLPQHKKLKLTEETAKDITERMKKIAEMPDGREKTVSTAEVLKTISDQVPASLLSKVSNFQTISQLLNPKTAIRNVLGNAGFNLIENVKDVVSTPLDIGLSKLTGQRTVTLPNLKTQGQSFVKGLREGYEESVKGIDTTGIKTQFDLQRGSMFNSKFGKSIEKLLNVELKAPDRAFYQAAYDDSIRKQLKLTKVLDPTEAMIENAHLDALYKTFQDDNSVSKAFSSVKKALNLGKEFGLGDIVMKYPKTPANILMRAADYSPAGYLKTLIQLAKDINSRNFNQKEFVESIGRATTGTAGLVGTGYILNQLGIITGQSENDYDTKEVERTVGLGDYKINVSALKRYISSGFNKEAAKAQKGDTITDYSFMQPMAIGLVIGADISQNKANPNGSISRLTEAIMTGTDTFVEQPLMQGIKRLTGQGSTSEALMETLKGVPASFVPSLLNQVRQLTDNVSRNTYDPSLGKQSMNLVKNKIPGLSKKLEPRIDVLGKEKEVFQGGSNKPLNVFLNPAITTKYQDKPAAQLSLDIFKASGEKIQMPRLVDNKITYKGETYKLTPKELTEYQRYTGKKTEELYKFTSTIKEFSSKSAAEKAKELQKILTQINTEAKNKILKDRGIIE